MVFHSMDELKQYILSRSGSALRQTVEQVYQIIDKFVKEFYAEYSPEMYERTYQLYRSLVKTDIQPISNGWRAEVYFDYSSLVYTSGAKPSGLQVMETAAHGGHGAEGLHIEHGGTAIWDEPMAILQTQAIEILKRMLISNGIPVR